MHQKLTLIVKALLQMYLIFKVDALSEAAFQGCYRKTCSENMQQIYRGTPMPNCDFNNVAKHISAWVFSCKFAAYFQNTFSQKHLWMAASELCNKMTMQANSLKYFKVFFFPLIRRIRNLELGEYKSGTTHKNCLLPHKVSTNFRHRDGLSNKHEDIHKQISLLF